MISPRPFQKDQYVKNANHKNKFKRSKNMVLAKEMSQERQDNLKSWITLFRNNPSIGIEYYMGFKLFPYQRYWVNLMAQSTTFMGYASRGSAKSMLIAAYSIWKCIFFPGTMVSLNSATKAQAGLIVSLYCKMIYDKCANVQNEAEAPVCNANKWEMKFFNGSSIFVLISGENARGNRATTIVLEERRLIPSSVIDTVIRPFSKTRIPEFVKTNPNSEIAKKYPVEESQEIIISSVYFKSHEWYAEAKQILKMIAAGDPDVKAIFLDYLISIKHGIKTKKGLAKEKAKMDSIAWIQEYCNIPYSSSSSSFYKIGFFNRNVKIPWRPQIDDITKKNVYAIPRRPKERRCICVDFALKPGATNDNTIIGLARLYPKINKGWETEICYLESHNGKNGLVQALRIKQLWDEFCDPNMGDVLILDVLNAGALLYDILTGITKDDARGKEYDGLMVMQHEAIDEKVFNDLKSRSFDSAAHPCIFPISATPALNSKIAVSLRDRLKRKLLTFLVDDNTEESFLIESGNKDILNQDEPEMRAYLLSASVQTTLMINECIALDMSVASGNVKLEEPSGSRKDRFSMLSYLSYFWGLEDAQLMRKEDTEDQWSAIFGVTMVF